MLLSAIGSLSPAFMSPGHQLVPQLAHELRPRLGRDRRFLQRQRRLQERPELLAMPGVAIETLLQRLAGVQGVEAIS